MSDTTTASPMAAAPIPAPAEPAPPPPAARSWFRTLWIYGLMLISALVGIGYTSTGGPRVTGWGPSLLSVWVVVLLIYLGACIWHGWEPALRAQQRTRLVVTQVLHWLTFLAAMQIVQMREVLGVMNDDAEGVTLLLLLAMGTVLAGVHAWSLPIVLTGVALAASVPLIAWVEQTAVLLLVVAGVLALIGGMGWVLWQRLKARRAAAG